MLTYDGAVKVIDFGIAKANTNSEATQVGTIKGKLSYLAPEYLEGFELDARYDEFAVGITLWEMLCSRKLFQAKNELSVLKQIQTCKITPPSQINPNVTRELDEIVMKALSKDRNHRYENLDQMNRALVRFLYSHYPDFNPSDLKTFGHKLFKDEIAQDERKFVEYGNIDIVPYMKQLRDDENKTQKIKRPGSKSISKRVSSDLDAPESTEIKKMREIEMEINPIDVEFEGDIATNIRKPSRIQQTNDSTYITKTQAKKSHTVRSQRNSRVSSMDDLEESKSSSSYKGFFLFVAASSFGFLYFQSDLTERLLNFNLKRIISGQGVREISSVPKSSPVLIKKKSLPPLGNVETQKIDSSLENKTFKLGGGKEGKILFGGVDIEMDIYVDGEKILFSGRPISVFLHKDIEIEVKKSGYIPFKKNVHLTPDKYSIVEMIPPLEKLRKGYLTSRGNYTNGSKLVYVELGELVEKSLPLKNVEIAVGMYEGKIVNPVLGTEKKVFFTIDENKKSILE